MIDEDHPTGIAFRWHGLYREQPGGDYCWAARMYTTSPQRLLRDMPRLHLLWLPDPMPVLAGPPTG